MSELSEKGLTLNTCRLLSGLESRGVCFPEDMSNFYIHRNLGQAMMNKAAGEVGPTWELMGDGEQIRRFTRGGERARQVRTANGREVEVEWEGRKFPRVQGYLPLVWILKHPAGDWKLGLYPDDHSFEVNVDTSPPHWR